jgi:hypothetical protein
VGFSGPKIKFPFEKTTILHFWANDDASKLAKGLRNALDKVNVSRN